MDQGSDTPARDCDGEVSAHVAASESCVRRTHTHCQPGWRSQSVTGVAEPRCPGVLGLPVAVVGTWLCCDGRGRGCEHSLHSVLLTLPREGLYPDRRRVPPGPLVRVAGGGAWPLEALLPRASYRLPLGPPGLRLSEALDSFQQLQPEQPSQPSVTSEDQEPLPGEHRPRDLGPLNCFGPHPGHPTPIPRILPTPTPRPAAAAGWGFRNSKDSPPGSTPTVT